MAMGHAHSAASFEGQRLLGAAVHLDRRFRVEIWPNSMGRPDPTTLEPDLERLRNEVKRGRG